MLMCAYIQSVHCFLLCVLPLIQTLLCRRLMFSTWAWHRRRTEISDWPVRCWLHSHPLPESQKTAIIFYCEICYFLVFLHVKGWSQKQARDHGGLFCFFLHWEICLNFTAQSVCSIYTDSDFHYERYCPENQLSFHKFDRQKISFHGASSGLVDKTHIIWLQRPWYSALTTFPVCISLCCHHQIKVKWQKLYK